MPIIKQKFKNMNTKLNLLVFILTISFTTRFKAQTVNDLIAERFFGFNRAWVAHKISYPVNHGRMDGYYDANPFQNKTTAGGLPHLGTDINSNKMGNNDYGDTVYCIGRGKVIYLMQMSWADGTPGSIIMILHKTKQGYIVSLYRHCRKSLVGLGDYVEHLQPISTIGNDGGFYQAHLHFEIRTTMIKNIETGYGNPAGYVDPIKFIKEFN